MGLSIVISSSALIWLAFRQMVRLKIFLACFAFSLAGHAQVDTEFWFAPPEVTSGHGDRPIYLRVSTLGQAAVISVTQPARGNVQIAGASVPAHTTQTLDLTAYITNLETIYASMVMATGIRVVSSAPVTAYYEIGASFNSDIFPLKGRNALGNNFVIPAQNFYNNSSDYNPLPSSSFDIVATGDNTVVWVKPTKPLVGHLTDTLIVVKLNRGETYSFRKPNLNAGDNPGGTVVTSNKPIAITIKDDSVINQGCRDILGEQLVPVEVAGTEYVVLKGFLETPEYLFITATEDDTHVFLQGSATPVTTLSAGQIYRHHITTKSTYVVSDKTIYVFHVTGFGCELGMAILPSINCKGSPQIGFTRTTNEFFGLNVLVMKEGISRFILNGSSTLIPASAFTAVPGTNDKWYTAQLSFSPSGIPVGSASLISNDKHSFQVGIINGNAASTCRYGYFSSFSTLFIGDDLAFCEGGAATLDAGPGKESYLWNTGATTQTIDISTPGEYWVKAEREDCILYDTIRVDVRKGQLDLGPDVEVCRGDTARFDGKENFSWQWSDGSRGQFLETVQAGKYWATVSDYTGCQVSDTVYVSLKELPHVDLGPDIAKCKYDEVTLEASLAGATYLWHDGLTTSTRTTKNDGIYSVTVSADGCSNRDSIAIENMPGPPQDSIYGTSSVCPFASGIAYNVEMIPGSTYQWSVEGGGINSMNGHEITTDWLDTNPDARVKVLVSDAAGCRGDTLYYPVRINVVLLPEIPVGPDRMCLNKSQEVSYTTPPTNGSQFTWNIKGGEVVSGQGGPEVLVNWTEGHHELWVEETSVTTDTVCQGSSPVLNILVYRDSVGIVLDYVSFDTTSASILTVDWTVENGPTLGSTLIDLNKRPFGDANWQLLAALPANVSAYEDPVDFSTGAVMEYHLSFNNSCEESIATAIHNNIFLAGAADSAGVIMLHWNHYLGWPEGVDRYELWRKADSEPGYRLISTFSPFETAFSAPMAADAFEHRYVIRAVAKNKAAGSWSNPVSFGFDHPVEIYNIITPNGDEFNQYFHISKIQLYRQSVLTILDRWGKVVYRKVNYQNDWDGAGLASGVYFYVLDLKKDNKVYRGPLTIL